MLRLLLATLLIAVPACSNSPSGADHDGGGTADTGTVDTGSLEDAGGPIDSGTDAFAEDAATTPDAGPIVDGGGSLTTCGGRSGGACSDAEYCDYDGAPCGTTDGSGICRARPDRCGPDTTRVCGCDGETYANACGAASAGTDVSSTGGCAGAGTFACGTALTCQTGVSYCEATVGGPPPGHTSFACQPLPASCTSDPSCTACFGSGGSECTEAGAGELTVTRLTP